MDQNSMDQIGTILVRSLGFIFILLALIITTSSWISFKLLQDTESEPKSGWTNYPPLETFANQEAEHEKYDLYRLNISIYGTIFSAILVIVGILLIHFALPLGKFLACWNNVR